jgi:hypothetical protein
MLAPVFRRQMQASLERIKEMVDSETRTTPRVR